MEAEYRGSRGQAFSDRCGEFQGTLAEAARMPRANNERRAARIAVLNAAARDLGWGGATVPGRDEGPKASVKAP